MNIGAAWKKTSQDGKQFLSARIEWPGLKLDFAIFPNENKRGENSPDYNIVWSNRKQEIPF